MEIRTLTDASGYGGQQYYVDDEGKFAGLVPANQPTTPANKAPTFSTPGSADYNPYTNPNATEEEKIQFRQNNFPYSPTNDPTCDLTGVRYGGDKPAYEYDLGDAYDNVVAVRQGGSVKFFKDGERVGSDVLGIDSLSGESGNQKISSLFNQLRDQKTQDVFNQFGGVEGDLVSQYLQDQALRFQSSSP